jgi:hypothetical protein
MRDDERRRLEELWTRFLGREALAPEERALLASALEHNEVFRRRSIQDLQIDGALRAAADIERGQEGVVAAVKALVTAAGHTEEVVAAVRRQIEAKMSLRQTMASMSAGAAAGRRRVTRAWAAAAVLAAGAAALLLVRPWSDGDRGPTAGGEPREQAPSRRLRGRGAGPAGAEQVAAGQAPAAGARVALARLEPVDGTAYRHGADGILRAGAALELGAGDWVSTAGASARARIVGPGDSRVELLGDVAAAVSAESAPAAGAQGEAPPGARAGGGLGARPGTRLFLAHGRATAVVPAGRGAALTLASPHAIVTGTGSLRLDVGPTVTRVEVRDGRARVSALGVQRGTEVAAGQFALVHADDLQPPRAQASARDVLLLIGPDDTKEEPPAADGVRGSEDRLRGRLERLGFAVTVADAHTLTSERARAAALLVFSPSVSSLALAGWFNELPVPMLVLESTGFEQLGLTGSRWRRDIGPTYPTTDLAISNGTHPLAGGLSGNVRALSAPLNLRWASPPAGAIPIASFPGQPGQTVMFGYERGATTIAGRAPARRVGLFLGNGRVIRALTEPGWKLFDAAVTWAAGG